jgi:hypothetical protein
MFFAQVSTEGRSLAVVMRTEILPRDFRVVVSRWCAGLCNFPQGLAPIPDAVHRWLKAMPYIIFWYFLELSSSFPMKKSENRPASHGSRKAPSSVASCSWLLYRGDESINRLLGFATWANAVDNWHWRAGASWGTSGAPRRQRVVRTQSNISTLNLHSHDSRRVLGERQINVSSKATSPFFLSLMLRHRW